jgi:hypothetical protein
MKIGSSTVCRPRDSKTPARKRRRLCGRWGRYGRRLVRLASQRACRLEFSLSIASPQVTTTIPLRDSRDCLAGDLQRPIGQPPVVTRWRRPSRQRPTLGHGVSPAVHPEPPSQ